MKRPHRRAREQLLKEIQPAFQRAARKALWAIENQTPYCGILVPDSPRDLQTYVSVSFRARHVVVETVAHGLLLERQRRTNIDLSILDRFVTLGPLKVLEQLEASLQAVKSLGGKRRSTTALSAAFSGLE